MVGLRVNVKTKAQAHELRFQLFKQMQAFQAKANNWLNTILLPTGPVPMCGATFAWWKCLIIHCMSAVLFLLAVNHVRVQCYQTNMNVKDVGGGRKRHTKNVAYMQVIWKSKDQNHCKALVFSQPMDTHKALPLLKKIDILALSSIILTRLLI